MGASYQEDYYYVVSSELNNRIDLATHLSDDFYEKCTLSPVNVNALYLQLLDGALTI